MARLMPRHTPVPSRTNWVSARLYVLRLLDSTVGGTRGPLVARSWNSTSAFGVARFELVLMRSIVPSAVYACMPRPTTTTTPAMTSSHGQRQVSADTERSIAASCRSISAASSSAGAVTPSVSCATPKMVPSAASMSGVQERLGVDVFQALFDRCSNWGRWGPDDERGTLNLITAEVRVRAARLVREGVTVSCAHPINTVGDSENSSPAMHFMVRAGDVADGTLVSSIADHLAVSPHGVSHSHLDALCHFFWRGQTYNGRPIGVVTSLRARANAITIGQAGIVSRGILLAIPRALGKEWLEAAHADRVAGLEGAE